MKQLKYAVQRESVERASSLGGVPPVRGSKRLRTAGKGSEDRVTLTR